jgi:bifunctional UDP-N-acetylglucosamine pyrophosphorylase/glucosamine-1-phosphate N-acetyltransferase
MDAVILAAGLGKRLRPYTLTTPKPLLPVRGRPVLDWTLAALPPSIDRIVVVVHYLAAQIQDYLERQAYFSNWRTVHQAEPRGSGDALQSCASHVESDRFLVINGDDLFGARDLAALAQHGAAILVQRVLEPRRFGIVQLNEGGTLQGILEKPDIDGPGLANTGAYALPRHVFDIALTRSSRGEYEITDYLTRLAQRQPVQVVEAKFWLPLGTVDAWQKAQTMTIEPYLRRPEEANNGRQRD